MAADGFGDFYAVAFQAICSQLHAFTGDIEEAAGITQEAFARALTRWKRLPTDEDPAAWVRRMAWHLATRPGRRWRRARGPLAALPYRQRQAVIIASVAGLSAAEIGRVADVSEATALSWLDRGQAAMHQLGAEVPTTAATVQPSNLDAVRARVRRRRTVRLVGVSSAAVVAVATAVAIPTWAGPPGPTAAATPDATGTGLAPTATAPLTLDPTRVVAPTASTTPTATDDASRRGDSGSGSDDSSGWTVGQRCGHTIQVTALYNAGWVTVHFDPTDSDCGDENVRFFWASYRVSSDGKATLFASRTYHLNAASPTRRFFIDLPTGCHAWYVVVGDPPIRQAIPASHAMMAYPSDTGGQPYQIHAHAGDPCPVATTPPTPTSPPASPETAGGSATG